MQIGFVLGALQRALERAVPQICKSNRRSPSASLPDKHVRCKSRAIPFRKLFDGSATSVQGCLKMGS
jgi:hypothetical protein